MRPGNRASCARPPPAVARARWKDFRRRLQKAGKGSWWCRAAWSGSRHSIPRPRRTGSNRVRDKPLRSRPPWLKAGRNQTDCPDRRHRRRQEGSCCRRNRRRGRTAKFARPFALPAQLRRSRHQSQALLKVRAQRKIDRGEHSGRRAGLRLRRGYAGCRHHDGLAHPRGLEHQIALD